MARPRKSSETVRVDITLSLTVGEDDDLITWFAQLPPRSRAAAVISRLRTGVGDVEETAVVSKEDAVNMLFSLFK
jgi:hypothetical protein